jgi:hypothetical protein
MSLDIRMRLEVRGHAGGMTNFQRIDWEKEAKGIGIGLLSAISNQDQLSRDWCSLGCSGAGGIPAITWHSDKFPTYLAEVACALPNLTLIASEYWSDNSIVGTRVFGAEYEGGSWEKNPEPLVAFVEAGRLSCDDERLCDRIIRDVSYRHYCDALKVAGLGLSQPVIFW